jgi:serine/threonine-protein kinase
MIDFGAANEFVGKATGTLVGKQSFIAPEQFRGKATTQSDLYALGCTLHFLLTGAEPVPLSVSHPRTINPAVSPRMDALVASLTAMNVEDRVSSATQLKALIVPEAAASIN